MHVTTDTAHADPTAFDAGFRITIAIAAGLPLGAAVMAFTGIKSRPAPGSRVAPSSWRSADTVRSTERRRTRIGRRG
jgi:hypothetical protein